MKIALVYKDVSTVACHIGLGVTALNLAASLKDAGYSTETWPVFDGHVLVRKLAERPDVTHVIMLAPWVHTDFVRHMVKQFPNVQFTVTCHSNVGFLQCDAWSMRTIMEQMELERDTLNFRVSGNCRAYCDWIQAAYNRPCAYLPNLYHIQLPPVPRPVWRGGVLRIGIFGATRVLKNLGTAVAGAVVMATRLQADTEIWVSGGREEGGKGVVAACEAMMVGQSHAKIVKSPWQTWAQFHSTARRMHLMLQPSFTESFNNVTADGIGQGVASVVGPAIDWVPDNWRADVDDPVDVAKVGVKLLFDPTAPVKGYASLQRYTRNGLQAWRSYLNG